MKKCFVSATYRQCNCKQDTYRTGITNLVAAHGKLSEERDHEVLGIERQQVPKFLAHTHVANWDAHLSRNRDHHATLCRAIQLSQDNSGYTDGLCVLPRLFQPILLGGGVH